MTLDDVWKEQARFNAQLHEPPTTDEERTAQTKEFVVHMHAELSELLTASGPWKSHRRSGTMPNRRAILEEAVDTFKFLVSTLQVWSVTPEQFLQSFVEKSAVVQQRYTEEWISQLNRPSVIVDIDNVLADYIGGLLTFLDRSRPSGWIAPAQRLKLEQRGPFISAEELGMHPTQWLFYKTLFRNSGSKRTLPLMPGARDFLQWCRLKGWTIILLTSRPMKEYAGMYADTLHWLQMNNLSFDHLWFSEDKSTSLAAHPSVHPWIQFAVDDDPKYVQQYALWGFPVFHLVHDERVSTPNRHNIIRVVSLDELREQYEEGYSVQG